MTKKVAWFWRRGFHFLFGVGLAALLHYGVFAVLGSYIPAYVLPVPSRPLLAILAAGSFLALLSTRFRVPVIYRLLKTFGKPGEVRAFPGKSAFFYVLAAFVAVWAFGVDIAVASLLILAVGDPVSHVIGKKYGRIPHPLDSKKFIDGNVAGMIAGGICAALFFPPLEAFAASAVAMYAEGIALGRVEKFLDDNIIVPMVAGAVLFILSLL